MHYQKIFTTSVAVTFLLTCIFAVGYGEEDYGPEVEVTDEDGDSLLPEEEVTYTSPKPSGNYYFAETFDDFEAFKRKWVVSDAKKEDTDENIAKYNGQWDVEQVAENALKNDYGLVLKSKAKHHAIAAELDKTFHFTDKPFIVQYEVNFQNGQECGGAYLKLLSQSKKFELRTFHDKTPYTIMFGPDKCGMDSKLHFIFKHKNPKNGTFTEKHSKKPTAKLDDYFKDKKPHLYTLVLNPDNSYEILVDNTLVNSGNLLEDFTPAVNPPMEIDDPNDKKPEDWDEREKIPDPDARRPEDWDEDAPRQIPDESAVKPSDWNEDEAESIPDPNAEKPSDWDEEMDGDWEPPLINNPNCGKAGCGKWKPPLIDNPAYKGKWYPPLIENPNFKGRWKPKKIPNPDYYEDKNPFRMTSIGAVGLELWSMSDQIYFDNILVTDDRNVAFQWAAESWQLKLKSSGSALTWWASLLKRTRNHPFLWIFYVLYITVPVVIYVQYICRTVNEEGVVTRIIQYTNSHPWLWAVYIVAIGLPVVLLVVFCCSSSEDKEEKRRLAEAKKTDAATADDDEPGVENVNETTADGEDEDVEEIEAVEGDQDDSTKEETPERYENIESENKNEVGDGDKQVEVEEEEPAEVPTVTENRENVVRSPRRRKARKE